MKNDLARMRMETAEAPFEVLFRHLHGGTEENHENAQSG
jgi:hypothetical protein